MSFDELEWFDLWDKSHTPAEGEPVHALPDHQQVMIRCYYCEGRWWDSMHIEVQQNIRWWRYERMPIFQADADPSSTQYSIARGLIQHAAERADSIPQHQRPRRR